MVKNKVAAIFGPQNRDSWMHVQSMCNYLEIPHFDTRWNYNWEREGHNAINVYPYGPLLGKVYSNLIQFWKWQSFAVIYQDNEGLIRLNNVFQSQRKIPYKIMVVQLPFRGKYHETLRKIKTKGHYNIVIDCHIDIIFKILEQAQQIDMMTEKHHYLITNLDFHTINSEPFSYSGTVITSVRLVDSSRSEVKAALESMKRARKTMPTLSIDKNENFKQMKTETALMFDAIYILANGSKSLPDVPPVEIKSLDCESNEKWIHGDSLFNYMNSLESFSGLSGVVGLSKGYRTLFELDIMELSSLGTNKIGIWKSISNELKMFNTNSNNLPNGNSSSETLRNKFLNITVIPANPYIMYKESTVELKGNDRFEGYCIELLEEIAKELHFNYTLYEVPNRSYHLLTGELKLKNADLALGDITITAERQAEVDFTTPFMNLGISILFRKPTKAAPNLLSFLSPFSSTVWGLMGLTYLGVSAILFTIARLTPYEWDNPYPCIQEPEEIINSYTWLNSLWFTIGSLMQQGSDIAPKASSTRAMAAIWWFFTLIMISSYTANLAAFLTVENLETPIKDVYDLQKQNKIKYGCLGTGSTRNFFKKSQVEIYQRIFSVMENDQSVYVTSNDEGKQRVEDGDYAYFIESTSNEYIVERNCNQTMLGGLLDSKGYGIAMQKNSPYRNELSGSILRLQEDGVLANLKTKWWKQKKGGGQCKDSDDPAITALGLSNVGGIFVVLVGGAFLAVMVAIFEFWWVARKQPISQRKPLAKAMFNELKMAIRCKGSKEVIKNKDEEPPSRFSLNDEYVYS
ncbi:hypothetical protein CHUAL_013729 [Chamberlinius hualienensis]